MHLNAKGIYCFAFPFCFLFRRFFFLAVSLFFLLPLLCAKPSRIISLDTATDSLILQIADLDNMVAVRERSKKPENSVQWERASQLVGLRREMAEEVYRLNPDLVFFGQWSGRATRELLHELGVPVHRLSSPSSWENVYANIRTVGQLVEEEERAERMIGQMQSRLDVIKKRLNHCMPKRAVFYVGKGSTYGKNSRQHIIMESAGLVNIAAEKGIVGLGKLSVEALLLSRPDIIIFSNYHKETPTLSRQVLDHPAFQELEKSVILVDLPSNKINCTDISLVDCVELLARTVHREAFDQPDFLAEGF